MPNYKATVHLKPEGDQIPEVFTITIDANNAIEAKALLQDRYGDGTVKSITRVDDEAEKIAS